MGGSRKSAGNCVKRAKNPADGSFKKSRLRDRTMFGTPTFSTAACRQRKLFEQAAALFPKLAACLVVIAVAACGGGGGANPTPTPVPAQTYVVSGQVQGAVNATVNLTGAKSAVATTDATGNFSFGGLANGAYSVTPTQSGMVFAPVVATATVSTANVTLAAFVASTAADALPDATVAAIAAASESPLSLSAMLNADGSSVADYLVSRGIVLPTTPSQLKLKSVTQRKFASGSFHSPIWREKLTGSKPHRIRKSPRRKLPTRSLQSASRRDIESFYS
jgi:hypothetical protein